MPLPELMLLADAEGEDSAAKWPNYIDDIYAEFRHTAADAGLVFRGWPVVCPYMEPQRGAPPKQPYQGKHFSFWHSMSTGPKEDERVPDFPRCERIDWIGWVIRNAEDPAWVRWWENERRGDRGPKTHVPLWLFEHNYAVILDKGRDRYFLRTSYVLNGNKPGDFEKEWKGSIKKTAPPPVK